MRDQDGSGNHFSTRKINAIYAFNDILAEKYSIKVILPEGTKNLKLSIGSETIDPSKLAQSLSFSYLDFVGRPVYTIEDLNTLETDRIIEIEYELDQLSIVKKPLIIFGILFSVMLAGIVLNRIKL